MPALKEKVRVVIGANDLLLAGVQRLVIDQITLLDRKEFDIHLVVLRQFAGRETFEHLIPDDVQVHQLHFKGFADLGEWRRLFKILSTLRPHVVKTATFFSNTGFLLLRPFFGYTVVAGEHNTVNKKPLWQRLADKILLPQAYTVIVDSKMVKDFISSVEGIDPSHFTVVYNGVDLKAIEASKKQYGPLHESIRQELGIPASAVVVFTAARLVKQKNHILMVEALAQLRKTHDNVYLVIAGEGALRPQIEAAIKAHAMNDRILMVGEHKDIHRLYSIADIFLLTSLHEGFCIVAMEGLAFGLPLVSTRVAGVNEYLQEGKNGFFVERDPVDIAHVLQRVLELSLEERHSFAEEGMRTASQYSTERYAAEVGAILLAAAKK